MHAHMRQSLQGEMGFIRLGFNEVGGSITRLQLCREKGDWVLALTLFSTSDKIWTLEPLRGHSMDVYPLPKPNTLIQQYYQITSTETCLVIVFLTEMRLELI